jgi:hypothetical protein
VLARGVEVVRRRVICISLPGTLLYPRRSSIQARDSWVLDMFALVPNARRRWRFFATSPPPRSTASPSLQTRDGGDPARVDAHALDGILGTSYFIQRPPPLKFMPSPAPRLSSPPRYRHRRPTPIARQRRYSTPTPDPVSGIVVGAYHFSNERPSISRLVEHCSRLRSVCALAGATRFCA